MKKLFTNLNFLTQKGDILHKDILIENGFIKKIGDNLKTNGETINLNNQLVIPGLIDVHVHLRDPGFSYKETIQTGTLAASKGGFTTIVAMPNVNPFPDNVETIKEYLKYIEKQTAINCLIYSCLTYKEDGYKVVNIPEIKKLGINYFTDDGGYGPRNDEVITEAMKLSKLEDVLLAFHCEDRTLETSDHCMLTCNNAIKLGVNGGMTNQAEAVEVKKYIDFAKKYQAHIHICHVSAKESVELIRKARKEGVDVTGEATCHHLTLTCNDVKDANFKMTPPLKTEQDRLALIEGLKDNTITLIASDHAPHSLEDKNKGLINSAFGISSLETSFPVLYTELVKTKILTLSELVNLMSYNPAKRFKMKNLGEIRLGAQADLVVVDLENKYTIHKEKFISKGKNTPYDKKEVYGKIFKTYYKGNLINWEE